MKPQIDKLYIYRQNGSLMAGTFDELNVKHEDGQEIKHMRGRIPEKSENIYRYALTINIADESRTLLMITECKKKKEVSKFFTKIKNSIKKDGELFNQFMTAESKPVETNYIFIYDN